MSEKIKAAYHLGQSIWYDNIQRQLIENGDLKRMIASGEIYGITSNPSIFQKAIAETGDYDRAIQPMAWSGLSSQEIFKELAVEDIQNAADLFLELYENTAGQDGYVSLEVNPLLAHDTEATYREVIEIWESVNRPNLMVKIPATREGLPAIRRAIAAGVNINVTLIFSVDRYAKVIDAYLEGLEERVQKNLPVSQIASVASFFVSRMDTKIDGILNHLVRDGVISAATNEDLKGKAGLANSRMAYKLFRRTFDLARFAPLKQAGARVQRPLWASTSTKDPSYSDVMYVDGLIAPHTVNTIPPKTLIAFRDHGNPQIGIDLESDDSELFLEKLSSVGIDMDDVTDALEEEGVSAFAQSYLSLLQTLENRMAQFSKQLGPLEHNMNKRMDWHTQNRTIERLFARDASLWSNQQIPSESIDKRLGWLDSPSNSLELITSLDEFYETCVSDGFNKTILLGMGGSSLAAAVMAKTLEALNCKNCSGMSLEIIDTTNPSTIGNILQNLDFPRTLFIVSSKSGTSSETLALMDFFWEKTKEFVGDKAGRHFVAVTDPGTQLVMTATQRHFRAVFLADPEVGGRFSALTSFGLLPARMLNIDIHRFLDQAGKARQSCSPDTPLYRNPGLVFGSILAEGALQKIDKLTMIVDPQGQSFGSWAEQLVAESSGKSGKGIIPVDLEPVYHANQYSEDRLFVYLRLGGQNDKWVQSLINAGHPALTIDIHDFYELAEQFFIWEIATAIACMILEVNAFDQPNVQDSKDRTKQKIEQLQTEGKLQNETPNFQDKNVQVFWKGVPELLSVETLKHMFDGFLSEIESGDYFSINAFLPEDPNTEAILQNLRKKISQEKKVATTLGFGPRYLHSTGQLHKGGPNKGHFLVITHACTNNLQIPGQNLSFCNLIEAQALGDIEALHANGRRVMHLHLISQEALYHLSTLLE